MNIFATSECPTQSALNLDDLRLRKMIIESAQILSTAIYLRTRSLSDLLYRPTHKGHPCVRWAYRSRDNFLWLYRHGLSMAVIHRDISGVEHASEKILHEAHKSWHLFSNQGLTEFENCTTYKDGYEHVPIFDKYRLQMIDKWNSDLRSPKWTRRQIPDWYTKQRKQDDQQIDR